MHRALQDSPTPIVRSPIHRAAANIKVGIAIAMIVLIVIMPPRYAWALLGVVVLQAVIMIVGRISPLLLLKRVLMLEPFAFGVAALSLFQPGGWRIMLLMVGKCTLCFVTTILLSLATSVSELVQTMRAVHLPSLMITTMLLMHRYLFVLLDESQRMRRARASRAFTKRRWFEWGSIATIVGQLFIRSVERSERVYNAMCARGWR